MPVCVRREYPHYSGNRHYSACCHYWLFLPMPSDFTGTIAGNRHYSTGTIEEPLLCKFGDVALTSQHENQGQRHISMSAPGQVTPDESAQTQKRNTLPLRFMYAVGFDCITVHRTVSTISRPRRTRKSQRPRLFEHTSRPKSNAMFATSPSPAKTVDNPNIFTTYCIREVSRAMVAIGLQD